MPPRISLAMIVKNESTRLQACLDSVGDLASELCIVDTGSSDNTLEIARSAGAKLTVFLLCDDFADARNESLRLCSEDWVLVLDADEVIAAEDHSKLRRLAQGPQDCCFRFVTRNYTNNRDIVEFCPCSADDPYARDFAGWYPSTKVRLFPNNKGGKFEGNVHEMIDKSLEKLGIRILDTDVPIHHYGQARAETEIRAKQSKYLDLGHRKVQENPTDVKGFIELGKQYGEVGDHANAAGAYREALKIDPKNVDALHQLGGMLFMLRRPEEAMKSLNLAIRLDPNVPSAWRNLGVVHADAKRWPEAHECFEKAYALDPNWNEGLRYLAVCLEGLDRTKEAAEYARKALRSSPNSTEALKLFVQLEQKLQRRSEAREQLASIIDAGAKNPELHNVLGELYFYDKMYDDSKAHFGTAAQSGLAAAYNNLGIVHFSLREYDEAQAAFENCLKIDPAHTGAQTNLGKVRAARQAPA